MPLKGDFKALDAFLDRVEGRLRRAEPVFKQAVSDEVTAMLLRTQAGRDKNDRPFKEYADSTKSARLRKKRQVDHVDLYDTGGMQAAVQLKDPIDRVGDRLVATIGVTNTSTDALAVEKAKWAAQGSPNRPKRQFLGFLQEQKLRVQEKVRAFLASKG